jgi:hypothetical protein
LGIEAAVAAAEPRVRQPGKALALGIGLARLPVDQRVDLLVAIAGVALRELRMRLGPQLFESNFPPDGVSSSYAVLWNAFKLLAAGYSADEKAKLFSGTAKRVYRLA